MFRLLTIWWYACRYRLDVILFDYYSRWWLRILFLPAYLFARGDSGENLRLFFQALGPVAIKFGQLLSTRPDIVPKHLALQLNLLQDQVPAFDARLSMAQITSALNADIAELFAEFDEQPIASASLAQVHKATLFNDENQLLTQVAVKVLRPNIHQKIKREIKFLRWAARWLQRLFPEARRLKPQQVVEDYAMVIIQECDFRLEAANTQAMHNNFIGDPIHYTPKVYWPYVRSNILVTEFIDAIPVSDIEQMRQFNIDLQQLAKNGVTVFFRQVFEHNCFHADMHPGNIFVSKHYISNPQYIAIDCAIVGSLSDMELFQIGSLWLAVFERNYSQAAEIMIASGWVRPQTPFSQLQAVIRALYEPIHDKPFAEIGFSQLLLDLFDQTRIFGLNIKPSQILLQKTLINIEGLGMQLYPELDMTTIAKSFLQNWLKQRLQPKQILKKWAFHGPMLLEQLHQLPQLINQLEIFQNQSK